MTKEPKAKPSRPRKDSVAPKAAPAALIEDASLSIDHDKKHIRFGANLVPTKILAKDDRYIPGYEYDHAACADLVANVSHETEGAQLNPDTNTWVVRIPPRALVKIDAGFAMQLPPGWQAEVCARSGWASRGLIVLNGPGQVDEDYRGPLCVLLGNMSKHVLQIGDGDRIGQIKPAPVFRFAWEKVDSLDETKRGQGGFGSSGF